MGNQANASRALPIKQKDQGEYLPRIAKRKSGLSFVSFHNGV